MKCGTNHQNEYYIHIECKAWNEEEEKTVSNYECWKKKINTHEDPSYEKIFKRRKEKKKIPQNAINEFKQIIIIIKWKTSNQNDSE